MMNAEQTERYSRHILLDGVGHEGQERIVSGKVLIVGAGGLGSPIALYLAAAGVGAIGIADGDTVSLSNLQRQVIHFTDDIGKNKAVSAAEKMRKINPLCQVAVYDTFIDDEMAGRLIADYDFVIEATDNFASRYRINDTCVRLGKPFCIGGVSHYSGQMMTHLPGTATYRDLFPDNPSSDNEALPVLGPAVGILGTMMATEAVKYLAGIDSLLTNRLLTFDARTMEFNNYTICLPTNYQR